MSRPEGSHGEHDAPVLTGKPGCGERDAPRTSEPTGKHLYLIFDDWQWGYSIRKLKLPPRPRNELSLRPLEQRRLHPLEPRRHEHKRLPPPCICLEAIRRNPMFFAAVGTNIIAAHHRNSPVLECIMPIVDVRSMGIRFGPALLHAGRPIMITVGDVVFALQMNSFSMLCMKPLRPSREWSWYDLPIPPSLKSLDVTSAVVGSDGRTIFVSTDRATFAFVIVNSEWNHISNCSLPFAGLASYVPALNMFVGLSNAPDTYGHLCFCYELGGAEEICKENLFSRDPASHVGATLVYLGGSRFCLVECVSITEGKSVTMRLQECDQLVNERGGHFGELDQLKKNVGDGASGSMQECGELDELKKFLDEGDGVSGSMQECGELDELKKFVDEGDGASGSMHFRFLYRLMTFSLNLDSNGDLTIGETFVQCYKVPEEVSEVIYLMKPVAFWL